MNISKEELNKKGDWIKIDTYHERYCFETRMEIYRNTTIKKILEGGWSYDSDIECIKKYRPKFPDEPTYIIDSTHRKEAKLEYTNRLGIAAEMLDSVTLDVTYIFDLNWWLESEYASFVWGKTECKYGLLDIKK